MKCWLSALERHDKTKLYMRCSQDTKNVVSLGVQLEVRRAVGAAALLALSDSVGVGSHDGRGPEDGSSNKDLDLNHGDGKRERERV